MDAAVELWVLAVLGRDAPRGDPRPYAGPGQDFRLVPARLRPPSRHKGRVSPGRAGRILATLVGMPPLFRPPLDRLGFHRLGAVCLALQIGVLLLTVWSFWVTGLSYVWHELSPMLLLPALALGAWGYFVWLPGRRAADSSSPKHS